MSSHCAFREFDTSLQYSSASTHAPASALQPSVLGSRTGSPHPASQWRLDFKSRAVVCSMRPDYGRPPDERRKTPVKTTTGNARANLHTRNCRREGAGAKNTPTRAAIDLPNLGVVRPRRPRAHAVHGFCAAAAHPTLQWGNQLRSDEHQQPRNCWWQAVGCFAAPARNCGDQQGNRDEARVTITSKSWKAARLCGQGDQTRTATLPPKAAR
jgi:hypothetical protein